MLNDYYSPWISSPLDVWETILSQEFTFHAPKGDGTTLDDQINCVYLVKSGQLMQTIVSQSGTERIVMFLGPGAVFGEMSLFEATPTVYAVHTLSDSEIFRIPKDHFLQYLRRDQALCFALIQQLTQKVAILAHQASDLVFGTAYQRIAAELLYFTCSNGVPTPRGIVIDLDITQQLIARRIGASRETVCKVMGKMMSAGILSRERGRYVVRDERALHKAIAVLRED